MGGIPDGVARELAAAKEKYDAGRYEEITGREWKLLAYTVTAAPCASDRGYRRIYTPPN